MKTIIKSPQECSTSEIETFTRLTVEGGQVSPDGLERRIRQAEKLVFVYQDDTCIAIAGLKNPLSQYKSKVFKSAGVEDQVTNYKYEVGYIFSKVAGVGNELMKAVVEAAGDAKVFATTRDSNSVMQHLLPKYGFERLGDSYWNNSNEYLLGLFAQKI
ncbi:N-acetyltransferase [Vibrio parahaemolyticus]|nr:N-acetyltransferase [Vibrio parahaemolyticus]